jgi:5-dehydro-2-deoxygluconokinase
MTVGTAAPELITMGRSGVDIYPEQVGRRLEDVERFVKFVGGSPTNVAVAAARLGRRVSLITGVGDDPFGRYVRRELEAFGVDTSMIVTVPSAPTPVTFCEIFPPDHFPIYFHRHPAAPDLQLREGDLDLAAIAGAAIFWCTVTGLSVQPSRAAHHAALRARRRSRFTVLDLDYRPTLWSSDEEASAEVAAVLPLVDVAVGNRDECRIAVGTSDPDEAADRLLAAGVALAVVKQGPAGVLAATADERLTVPAFEVEVVNGLGAGDGFGGALCHGLLAGWPLAETIAFAGAAGAIVAGRLGCSAAMPTVDEIVQVRAAAADPAEAGTTAGAGTTRAAAGTTRAAAGRGATR